MAVGALDLVVPVAERGEVLKAHGASYKRIVPHSWVSLDDLLNNMIFELISALP